MRELRGGPAIASLVAEIAELKKDRAADQKANQQHSFIQEQEIVALRNDISTIQNKMDAFINKFADSKVFEHATTNKDDKAKQDDDDDFDGDSEEHLMVNDGDDIHQARYETLKELIEKACDEIYLTIVDNRKDVEKKLATKFQKRLDVVSGGLAEHVVHIEELKESGKLVSITDLQKQINKIWEVINNGPQSQFDLSEERNNEKTRFTNTDNSIQTEDFEALKQEVYDKFKLFAGEVDRELKRMNMKLRGLPATAEKCEEVETYLARVEAKMDNVQQWIATLNQKLVDSGKGNLMGPQY